MISRAGRIQNVSLWVRHWLGVLVYAREKAQGETLNGWGSRRQLHAVAFPPAHCRGWWQCDILYTSLNRWFFNILRHILPFICSRGLASLKVKCLFARRASLFRRHPIPLAICVILACTSPACCRASVKYSILL